MPPPIPTRAGISQSLLVINPTTASIEQTVSLGQSTDPTSIVLSDDGNYAYIVDSISNQVLQVDLGLSPSLNGSRSRFLRWA